MEVKIKGNVTKVKEQMKKDRRDMKSEIDALEKKKRKNKGILPAADQKQLKHLETTLHIYSVSSTLPVTYKGIIINGKLLQSFLKKVKKFPVELSVNDNKLQLLYYTSRTTKGKLELYNISKYFEGYPELPPLEVIENE